MLGFSSPRPLPVSTPGTEVSEREELKQRYGFWMEGNQALVEVVKDALSEAKQARFFMAPNQVGNETHRQFLRFIAARILSRPAQRFLRSLVDPELREGFDYDKAVQDDPFAMQFAVNVVSATYRCTWTAVTPEWVAAKLNEFEDLHSVSMGVRIHGKGSVFVRPNERRTWLGIKGRMGHLLPDDIETSLGMDVEKVMRWLKEKDVISWKSDCIVVINEKPSNFDLIRKIWHPRWEAPKPVLERFKALRAASYIPEYRRGPAPELMTSRLAVRREEDLGHRTPSSHWMRLKGA